MKIFTSSKNDLWVGIIQNKEKIYANTIPMKSKESVLNHLKKYSVKIETIEVIHTRIIDLIFNAWLCKPIRVDKTIFDFSGYSEKEKLVLDYVYNIEYGRTVTYEDVAKAIGLPKAYRFVGNVMQKNRFPLLIPCHRVIRKDGFGKYGYGEEIKRRLIMCERRNVNEH